MARHSVSRSVAWEGGAFLLTVRDEVVWLIGACDKRCDCWSVHGTAEVTTTMNATTINSLLQETATRLGEDLVVVRLEGEPLESR